MGAARGFLEGNSDALSSAWDALSNADGSEFIKKTEQLLSPVKKIIEHLDGLAKLHPFVGGESLRKARRVIEC